MRGVKSMLCSKLLDNKIILFNSEKLGKISTNVLGHILNMFHRNKVLMITGENFDKNFEKSQTNLNYIKHITPGVNFKLNQQVNVLDLISYKYLILTIEGLEELINTLKAREQKCLLRKVNKDRYVREDPAAGIEVNFDVTKDLDIKTRSLQNYLEKEKEYLSKWQVIRQKEISVIDDKDKDKKIRLERKKKDYDFKKDRKQKRLNDRAMRENMKTQKE